MTVADPAIDSPRTRAEHVRSRRGHIRQPAERAARSPGRSASSNRRPRRVWELAIPAEVGAAPGLDVATVPGPDEVATTALERER